MEILIMTHLVRPFALSLLLLFSSLGVNAAPLDLDPQAVCQDPYTVAKEYVTEFYPLILSHTQSRIGTYNRLAGPDRISPLYHVVVAINDDTLYASSFVNLKEEPLILTIPSTPGTYSILTLDGYGNIFESGIQAGTSGIYALTGPGWSGTLPEGIKPMPVPLDYFVLIFRADKFSSTGEDQRQEADQFRRTLKAQTLSNYLINPSAGETVILPEVEFSLPFKTTFDAMVQNDPVAFLKLLQRAVASPNTPPLSATQAQIVKAFDQAFQQDPRNSELIKGAQAAHDQIVNGYKKNTGPTQWINYDDIGAWGDNSLARSQIAEYIQYANGRKTAMYYHAFTDANRSQLNGKNSQVYTLTFPAGQQPPASRFWSLTAYTPEAIELIPNSANKYVVASYTPPAANPDGSITIFMSNQLPEGVAESNWLPVLRGPFNVMLRIYGSEGKSLAGTYLPPAIIPMPK
jgi:hypothetical protein